MRCSERAQRPRTGCGRRARRAARRGCRRIGAQIAQLPARVVDVAARGRRATATRRRRARLGHQHGGELRASPQQCPVVAEGAEEAHARRSSAPAGRGARARPPIVAGSDRPTRSRTSALLHQQIARDARSRARRRCCRCSSIQTGRMLQSCDDEQRSSSTGCDTQCRSNVECSDAAITSRTLISLGGAARARSRRARRACCARCRRGAARSRICST